MFSCLYFQYLTFIQSKSDTVYDIIRCLRWEALFVRTAEILDRNVSFSYMQAGPVADSVNSLSALEIEQMLEPNESEDLGA